MLDRLGGITLVLMHGEAKRLDRFNEVDSRLSQQLCPVVPRCHNVK